MPLLQPASRSPKVQARLARGIAEEVQGGLVEVRITADGAVTTAAGATGVANVAKADAAAAIANAGTAKADAALATEVALAASGDAQAAGVKAGEVKAEVAQVRDINAIGDSYTDPTSVMVATDNGTSATVKVLVHARRYTDGRVVQIAEQTFPGQPSNTEIDAYYDDLTLANPVPTIVLTTNLAIGQSGRAPGRHGLGRITTPVAGSAATKTGGGSYPPGGGAGGEVPRQIP